MSKKVTVQVPVTDRMGKLIVGATPIWEGPRGNLLKVTMTRGMAEELLKALAREATMEMATGSSLTIWGPVMAGLQTTLMIRTNRVMPPPNLQVLPKDKKQAKRVRKMLTGDWAMRA